MTTSPATTSPYVAKPGDTLSTIAARVLGNVTLWPKLALLNGMRDPRAVVPGQVIYLPAT